MNKFMALTVASVGLLTLTGCDFQGGKSSNVWSRSFMQVTDYNEAQVYAKSSHKDILMIFNIKDSIYTEQLKDRVTGMKRKIAPVAIYLDIQADRDAKNTEQQVSYMKLAQKYGVTEVPTLLRLNNEGEVKTKAIGVAAVEQALTQFEGSAPRTVETVESNKTTGQNESSIKESPTEYKVLKTLEDGLAYAGTGQLILLEFAGSDWCPPCKQMQKDVFSTKEWEDFAVANTQHVLLDFPRVKKLNPEDAAYNAAMAAKYGVTGFPTYIVVDKSGKEIDRKVGYLAGGVKRFNDWVSKSRIR